MRYTETPDDEIDWYKVLSSCCATGCYRTIDYLLLLEKIPHKDDFEAALGNGDLKLFLYLMMKTGAYEFTESQQEDQTDEVIDEASEKSNDLKDEPFMK